MSLSAEGHRKWAKKQKEAGTRKGWTYIWPGQWVQDRPMKGDDGR